MIDEKKIKKENSSLRIFLLKNEVSVSDGSVRNIMTDTHDM